MELNRRWLLVLLGITLTACPQNISVHVREGSTNSQISFRVSNFSGDASDGRLSEFEVLRRTWPGGWASETVWRIAVPNRRLTRLASIEYGRTPAGFVEVVDYQFLAPGRYYATAGGTSVEFLVGEDGGVVEIEDLADRYAIAGLRDSAVVELVAQLQVSLRAGDSIRVSEYVRYPLRVNSSNGATHVRSASELLARYRNFFAPDLIESVLAADPSELYANYAEVWIGDLRVAGVCESARALWCTTPKVVALNLD